MTSIYIVGYTQKGALFGGVAIVAGYTNKERADNLRQQLAQQNKGDEQFVVSIELDPL